MNILRIVPYFKCEDIGIYQNSGFCQTIYELNKSQIARGDKVFLLSNYRISHVAENFEIVNPVHFIRFSFHSILMFLKLYNTKFYNFKITTFFKDMARISYAISLNNIIENKNIDIIHIHSLDQNVALYLSYLNRNKIKYILTLHYNYSKKNYFTRKNGFQYLSNQNCLITTISTQLQEDLSNITDINVEVINNGILKNEELIRFDNNEFNHFVNSQDDTFLLFTGSLIKRKDPSFLIDVVSFLPKDYKLILCGDGPLKQELLNQINRLKLNERVLILGHVDHKYMNYIFSCVDFLCVVSKSEAFGRMVIESNSVGTPVFLFSDLEAVKDFSVLSGVKIINRLSAEEYASSLITYQKDKINKNTVISDITPFYWNNIVEKYNIIYQYLKNY